MALTTRIKSGINRVLRFANLRVDTLTVEKAETRRLRALETSGYFDHPVFPVPPTFRSMDPAPILDALHKYRERLADLSDPSRNEVGYCYDNAWFSSPDAEVLYVIVRTFRPGTVVEVGSGYSTRVIRQAILDGGLDTRLISIDPQPRAEVEGLADEVRRVPVEAVPMDLFRALRPNDILFIDSSHTIKPGGDVVFLYLRVIPSLAPGTLVHIHDVFIPWDYPKQWVVERRWEWNEQYLVHAMLTFSNVFEVLYAGHFLQKTLPRFESHFPHANGRIATSMWLRKVK